jgi:hypothetical protein
LLVFAIYFLFYILCRVDVIYCYSVPPGALIHSNLKSNLKLVSEAYRMAANNTNNRRALLTGIGSVLVAAGLVAVIASSNAQSPNMRNKSVPTRSELLEAPHSSEIITNKVP